MQALITFYETATLPKTATVAGWHVGNVQNFVDAHIRYVKAGQPRFIKPYAERLQQLKTAIENANQARNNKP